MKPQLFDGKGSAVFAQSQVRKNDMDIDQTWHAPGHISGNILIAGAKPHPTNVIEEKLSSEVMFYILQIEKFSLMDSTFR